MSILQLTASISKSYTGAARANKGLAIGTIRPSTSLDARFVDRSLKTAFCPGVGSVPIGDTNSHSPPNRGFLTKPFLSADAIKRYHELGTR
jgi:hypothetical protein